MLNKHGFSHRFKCSSASMRRTKTTGVNRNGMFGRMKVLAWDRLMWHGVMQIARSFRAETSIVQNHVGPNIMCAKHQNTNSVQPTCFLLIG